jgi:hypothetical protein
MSLALASAAMAGEEEIPVKRLPKAVIKAVKARFPKAEIKGAAKEEEDGKTTYEVMLKVKGRAVDMALKADGTILEIEKEVPVDELPKAVKKALAARHPKAKIAKAEVLTKGEHGPALYEIAITSEVVLSAEGKFVEPEGDEEHHEKATAKSKKSEKDDDEDDDDDDDNEKSHAKAGKSEKGEHHEKAAVESQKDKDDDEDMKIANATTREKNVKSKKDKDDDEDDDEKSHAKAKKSQKHENHG